MSSCSFKYNETTYSDFIEDIINGIEVASLLSIRRLGNISDNDIFVFLRYLNKLTFRLLV